MYKYSDANGEFIARTIEVEADGHLVCKTIQAKYADTYLKRYSTFIILLLFSLKHYLW